MPPKKSPGDARKDIKHAAIHGEEIEKTQEFWEWSDAIKYEAVTKRGTIFKETDNGKKAVESALDRLLVPFAEIAGWRTLDAISQGRELATRFRGQLRDVMAQALASSKQLNEGYGLQAPPESETPSNTYGQVEADGLLTPGSSPKSAIDVDNVDGVVRNNNIRRGSLYEEKLRMASTNYRLAHHNDALKPFHLLCYKLLWTFKKSAQQAGIWNVFSHSVDSKMPFDDPDVRPTRIYVGGLVRSFCPLGISPDFIRGLDNDAVTGWLFSHTIELLYKWTRPEPLPGQPYYLPASCTRLLESNIQQELRLSNHSLEQLYQDLRAKKPVDMERWTDIVDWHVFRVPADATRVFFFCNPGAAANHWIVVAGDIVRMDNGGRSGKITIYDSLGRDIARADALTLQKFFYVISGIEDSTLYGIDWMSAPVVSGPSCQQDNGQDCGLFALDNLSALAHGREPSHLSPVTALDRRQGYMSRTLSIVSEISGITIPDPEAGDGGTGDSTNGSNGNQDDLSRDLRAVLEMVERFTLAHWQYMIVQAQPHLANDLMGSVQTSKGCILGFWNGNLIQHLDLSNQ